MNFLVFPYSLKIELEHNLIRDGELGQKDNLLKPVCAFLKDWIRQLFHEDPLSQNFEHFFLSLVPPQVHHKNCYLYETCFNRHEILQVIWRQHLESKFLSYLNL